MVGGGGGNERLRHGCVLSTRHSQNESTALIEAAERGHFGCVRLLVESGADMDVKDNVRAIYMTYDSLCLCEHQRF
jgi:ankyrin repeat protein